MLGSMSSFWQIHPVSKHYPWQALFSFILPRTSSAERSPAPMVMSCKATTRFSERLLSTVGTPS